MAKAKIRALLLTGYGINSDRELAASFERAGAEASRVHVNDLIAAPDAMFDHHLLAVPGGFSFGDHLGSGRVLANKMKLHLGESLARFVAEGRPVIGICNGFQVLVKLGLLPGLSGGFTQDATLTHNDSGLYEDRWVRLAGNRLCKNVWTAGIDRVDLPVRHGEGKLVPADAETLKRMKKAGLDAFHYADEKGKPTAKYPQNPNGSTASIAALSDEKGRVFGLMPHPEAFFVRMLQPRWKHEDLPLEGPAKSLLKKDDGAGMAFFHNAIRAVRKDL